MNDEPINDAQTGLSLLGGFMADVKVTLAVSTLLHIEDEIAKLGGVHGRTHSDFRARVDSAVRVYAALTVAQAINGVESNTARIAANTLPGE